MRVLVTGGTGAVGKAAVKRLVDHGWEVRVIGRRSGFDIPGADYRVCDIGNYAELREQMRGCRTVVHLAAVPNPTTMPGQELFQINTAGTYNVYEAAAAEGITKLVQASSINAFGCFWNLRDFVLDYLPIDEAHPTYTTDPYAFSKNVIESIGDYYWRREGISSVALRLPGVWSQERIESDEFRARQTQMRAALDKFAALPEDERNAKLAEVRRTAMEFRRSRALEYPNNPRNLQREGPPPDPIWIAYTFHRFDFWAYVDERDSAQSIEKGLTADYEGSHALFINDSVNSLDYPSQTLARLFFPEIPESNVALQDADALVSIAKAKQIIGFEPEFSVRNQTPEA
ncbi:MAG: NAD(P)-dependent oxidoreductase [Caldilineaceae bacterium]|nr:NAD(P)-dependent oxidoreductase [Caldilineaceae bacterium]